MRRFRPEGVSAAIRRGSKANSGMGIDAARGGPARPQQKTRGAVVPQLKILQEAITLVVFLGFAWYHFREAPRWNEGLAMVLILAAVVVAFAFGEPRGGRGSSSTDPPPAAERTP
jgi:hypothetical protein